MGLFKLFKSGTKQKINDTELVDQITNTGDVDLVELYCDPNAEFLSSLGADELNIIVQNMLRDDQVSSDIATFKSFITEQSSEVKLNAAVENDSTAKGYLDLYNDVYDHDGGQLLISAQPLLEALDYGSVICEVVWAEPENNGGKWYVRRLIPLDHSKFGFNQGGQMVDIDTNEILDDKPYKYISVSHNVTDGNLYGNSMLLTAYWPWIFKKACIRSGILYAKKSIIPSLIAIYKAAEDRKTTAERGQYIAAQLSKLSNSSGIAMANVESIESVSATSKGDDIISLVNMFNQMISKAILGTGTLTNESKFSSQKTSGDLVDIVKLRAKRIAQTEQQPAINKLFRWHLDLNTQAVDPSKTPFFAYSHRFDPTIEQTLATVNTQQVPISANWFRDKYGMTAPENDEDIAGAPSQNFSAENDSFFLRKPQPNAHKVIKKILKNIG